MGLLAFGAAARGCTSGLVCFFLPRVEKMSNKAISRAPALAKLWHYHKHTTGMVTRSLSPFEQQTVMPMFKNLGPKVRSF